MVIKESMSVRTRKTNLLSSHADKFMHHLALVFAAINVPKRSQFRIDPYAGTRRGLHVGS